MFRAMCRKPSIRLRRGGDGDRAGGVHLRPRAQVVAGRGFDLAAHQVRIRAWRPTSYPAVDIYLPICVEPIELLRNTWTAAAGMMEEYQGEVRAYVLDDGPSEEARVTAESFGFCYIHRPDWPAGKKAGNLRYAFSQTSAEYLVILDADFAPRRDFLAETMPYMDDPRIAIVQTPQYFRSSPEQTWIERAAGPIQEVFYRAVQVSRQRLDAAVMRSGGRDRSASGRSASASRRRSRRRPGTGVAR